MIRVETRTARKLTRCEGCGAHIEPGDRYLYHVASPHHDDLGNEHWWSLPECAACAARYDRPIAAKAG